MTIKYHIESVNGQLTLVDQLDRQVDRPPAEMAAKHHAERCRREEKMFETATLLVDIAIKAHMQMFGVDRETARDWIRSVSDLVD